MAIADHHLVVVANENPVRSATRAPFNGAAQRICHLYGSFDSKKIPTPPKAPNTRPMITTVGNSSLEGAPLAASANLDLACRSCDLTRHKISDREPATKGGAAKMSMANTQKADRSLARGSLHRLVRPLGGSCLSLLAKFRPTPASALSARPCAAREDSNSSCVSFA